MRKRTLIVIVFAAFVFCFAPFTDAEMQSDNYRIPSTVISSGGTSMESANYQMTSTFGQSSAIGQSSNSSYINYAGFWQPSEFKIRGKIMPWIPLLLFSD